MTRRARDLRKVEGEAQAKRLIALYRNAEADIVSRLQRMIDKYGTDAGKKPSVRLLRQQYKAIRQELKRLDAEGHQEAAAMVDKTYNGGLAVARRQLKDAGIVSGLAAEMSGVHKKALDVYSGQVQSRLSDLVTSAGRTVGDIYRQLQLNTAMSGAVAGTQTLKHVQDKMARLAEKGGLISFVDSAGRNWDMGSYVEMLSRTTLMQVHNAATWNEFAAHGEDLIQISYHTPTCGLCAPWNGKVLSLTGKTPGYPTLAEAEGAGLFHPNCRHASSLFIPESPEEMFGDAERLTIPEEKLTKYALNMDSERGRDKAIAFEKALGYNLNNYEDLISAVREAVPNYEPESRGRNQYGDLYQTIVKIQGPSGKKANVLIGWIYKRSENEVRMTTIHVTDKEAKRRENPRA